MSLKSLIETILFVYAEPIGAEKLAKITKQKKETMLEALQNLKEEYQDRGVVIIEKDGEYQLGSNPENSRIVEDLVKSEFTEELSRAAVETLAIIAYKGPITRADIEFLRGVNSSFTVRNMLMRGLVERIENPKDARSYLYRISFDFLKHFGLTAIEELPQFKEFREKKVELPEEVSSALDHGASKGGEKGKEAEASDEKPIPEENNSHAK